MIGAIIGDVIGSRFERDNIKTKRFPLFDKNCRPTDDSVMSLAVAKAILECDGDYENLSKNAVKYMQEMGRRYPDAGYGESFAKWIQADDPKPYGSYGNGSAMRVSPCGYAARSLAEAKELSNKVTEISHEHPEGIKGAEALAVAVFLAKEGKSKDVIRSYITENYYLLDFSLAKIRREYSFDVSCQGSVPVAFEAFFESSGFVDAIRNAISVGGDSDTIACMTGSLAEAYYGVPEDVIYEAIDYLDSVEMEILYYFEKHYAAKAKGKEGKTVFEVLDAAVDKIVPEGATIKMVAPFPHLPPKLVVDEGELIPDFSSFDEKDVPEDDTDDDPKKQEKKIKGMNEELQKAIFDYNEAYTQLSNHGILLFNQRERSIDLLVNLEYLINSIANRPKEFEKAIEEIQMERKQFYDSCDFATKKLEAAHKSAIGAGAGIAGGMAVASLAPSAAMWIATTFGTASTGTAISTLSGAVATKAALAWLGGGAIAAGGSGMAAGNALLALAGPVGWSIAGVSVLSSILLFRYKKIKMEREKKDEIDVVLMNTGKVKVSDAKIEELLKKTIELREQLNKQFQKSLEYYNQDYRSIPEDGQIFLGSLVNNAKALAASLSKGV